MGRAIVRDPKVFLFDEPLSNLDAKLRVQLRAEIKALHQRLNATVIYVTHDQIEAMTMADRIMVMRAGRIEQIGSPDTLYHRPANTFVASFIGSPAMNPMSLRLQDGRLVDKEGTVYFSGCEALGGFGPDVTAGIRPEDIRISDTGVAGRIDLLEPTGPETYLTVATSAGSIVIATRQRGVWRPGDNLRLVPYHERLHLFDATGNRIERSQPK